MEGRLTPQTNLYRLLADSPALIPLFIKKRLACVGCEMSKFETLGDLSHNYNLNLEDFIEEITTTMNKSTGDDLIVTSYFILYVNDQQRSANLYETVLGYAPRMNMPGMTEFDLGSNCVLGLMPLTGIARLFNQPAPRDVGQDLRAEVYLLVEDPQRFHERAITAGARELSRFSPRDWGHSAAYSVDFDGNVIAFAKLT